MIPFRTQRLATSVVNRIMNVYEGLQPKTQPGVPAAPAPMGGELDVALGAPKPAVDAAPDTAEAIALSGLVK